MAAEECAICCNRYNASTRKTISCSFCQHEACADCVKTYLLGSLMDPHCMSCRREWMSDFIDESLSKSWRLTTYKKHRENVLLDREKSLMPATQPAVERHVEMETLLAERRKLLEKKRELDRERRQLENNVFDLTHRYNRMKISKGGANTEFKREFIKACPVSECRGFLSTQWKCGICKTDVCSKCREIKGENHECDPEVVKTIAMIDSECRQCPKCPAIIYKVSGCFAKDVPMRMWDGSIKMSQEICVGDEMIGDDGNKRVVLDTFSGEDDMYEVHQNDGMTYTVNSKHTLVLKLTGDRSISWVESRQFWQVEWFDPVELRLRSKITKVNEHITKEAAYTQMEAFVKTLIHPEEVEIRVDQYIILPDSVKVKLVGFKSPGVHWPKRDVPLDPYLLGVWIGDGIVNGVCFTGQDTEVLQYIWDWCTTNGMEMVHDAPYKYRIRRREMSNGRLVIGRGESCDTCTGCVAKRHSFCDKPEIEYQPNDPKAEVHILRNELNKLGLIGNKHIPMEYIVNDRQTRLEMLAGLTDTDGCLSSNGGKRVQIVQSNKKIVDQIELLAKSLGYCVHVGICEKKNIQFNGVRKDYKDCYKINIAGVHLSDIPTLIQRKKCIDAQPNRDLLRTSIQVKHIGRGTYYGFMVDGNHRICLADLTCSRNCDQMFCTQCHTAFSFRTGRVETGVIHNPHFYEWQRQQNNGVAPRVAGDIPCGGMPTSGALMTHLRRFQGKPNYQSMYTTLTQLHRLTTHVQHVTIPHYRPAPTANPLELNEELRVSYLIKEIDEEQLKSALQKREKKRNKDRAIYQVLEVYSLTAQETFQEIVRATKFEDMDPKRQTLMQIIQYCNEQLLAICKRYHCAVPTLNPQHMTLMLLPNNIESQVAFQKMKA
jgi:hypothetical protein